MKRTHHRNYRKRGYVGGVCVIGGLEKLVRFFRIVFWVPALSPAAERSEADGFSLKN